MTWTTIRHDRFLWSPRLCAECGAFLWLRTAWTVQAAQYCSIGCAAADVDRMRRLTPCGDPAL